MLDEKRAEEKSLLKKNKANKYSVKTRKKRNYSYYSEDVKTIWYSDP